MVKTIFKCVICNGLGNIHICSKCSHKFCTKCIKKSHEGCIEVNNLSNERINYSELCPFRCLYSKTNKYCFDCGGNYINMIRCICCNMICCTSCAKHNLFLKKKFNDEQIRTAKLFCSLSCYEIFMENPNNKWLVCKDCGEEYFDISYKKLCSCCLLKHYFEKDILFNKKRKDLKSNLIQFLDENYLEMKDIKEILENRVLIESNKMSNIKNNKVTLNLWLNESNVGYNLCYNIWDDVINNFIKN